MELEGRFLKRIRIKEDNIKIMEMNTTTWVPHQHLTLVKITSNLIKLRKMGNSTYIKMVELKHNKN